MKHVRVSVTKEKSLIQREGVLSKDAKMRKIKYVDPSLKERLML